MDQKLRQVRKRLATDFEFYSRSSLKIRTKAGDIRPWPKPAQQILDDAVKKQMASKAKSASSSSRQAAGLSTYVGGYLYFSVSQQKARKAMILTHSSDSTRAVFDMTRRYHEHCQKY